MSEIYIDRYKASYKQDFIRLNTEWITAYFRMEESDVKALENVEQYIIDQDGQVFFAIAHDQSVIGCCALIKHAEHNSFELAKMAVSPSAQGQGVGRKLGEALIAYAKQQGIKQLFLEGNTKMEASIILYRKLGFKEIPLVNPAYERCDIMMILDL